MDKFEKLFRKISQKERTALSRFISDLLCGEKSIDIKKLKRSDFYRARKGNFRIIFHRDSCGDVVVDSIRLRNENTYKNF